MALLSHSAQRQVDQARDGIEDLQDCISRLTIFMNGFELWSDQRDFDDRIAYLEGAVAKVITQHFASESWEAHRLIARTRLGAAPSRSNKDRRKREFEHAIAIAIEALEDAIRLLRERIENIQSGRAPSTSRAQQGNQPPPAFEPPAFEPPPFNRNPTVAPKPTSRGSGIDLRGLWRRWRGG